MADRQPFSESDYNVMAEVLTIAALKIEDDRKRHRVEVLAKRLLEFRKDMRYVRESKMAYELRRAKDEAEANIRWREKRARDKQQFFDQHPLDEPGPWVIWLPSQNFDPHGGSHGDTFEGVEVGTWEVAANRAWNYVAQSKIIGLPRVEKAT